VRSVATIVEGDGEVQALPVLLRRLGEWLTPDQYVHVASPIRVHRDRFLNKEDEFRRHVLLAAAKAGEDGWILIVLDADDDCPSELGETLRQRTQDIAPHRKISVVLANREYEGWFLAACKSLDGHRTFVWQDDDTFDPEAIRDAKGWMQRNMTGGKYREIIDQPAFSAIIDLARAQERSRSFRKLCKEWLLQAGQG